MTLILQYGTLQYNYFLNISRKCLALADWQISASFPLHLVQTEHP